VTIIHGDHYYWFKLNHVVEIQRLTQEENSNRTKVKSGLPRYFVFQL